MRFETSALLLIAGAGLAAAQSPVWGQCGGIGWNGPTTCTSGNSCNVLNPYYSQCLPGGPVSPSASTTTTPTATQTTPTATPTTTPGGNAGSGLHGKIVAKGKQYYGVAVDQNTLSISQIAQIVRDEFGSVTPENSMKWDTTEGSQNNFNLGGGDYLVNWAQTNGKKVRGHTLVWHSQLPQWVSNINNKDTLTAVMKNHITTLMTRWKGKIDHWDVVNEVLEDNGSFRNSVFYRLLGDKFIDIAFTHAATVDPNAKLYLNDYNLDYASSKLTNTVAICNRLKAAGVPIHGVGTQSHLVVGNAAIPSFGTTLTTLASTGLDVAITELDIRMNMPSDSSKVAQQSTNYKQVHAACLAQPKCVGITVWGVDDGHSWIPGTFSGQGDGLLWSSTYQKKAAYHAVAEALS